jgi:AraC-like DNA-binding protein
MDMAHTQSCASRPDFYQCHEIRENIRLILEKGVLPRGVNFFSNSQHMVEIGFNMGEPVQFTLYRDSDNGMEIQVGHGVIHLSVCYFRSGALEYLKEQPINWLGIMLPLDVFQSFFEVPLESFFNDSFTDVNMLSKIVGPINAEMKSALNQILMCRYLGKTKNLFFFSKIIELISRIRSYTDCVKANYDISAVSLTSLDWEKMWQAKSILDQNLENPPSIVELARLLGTNDFKLKNGFRKVHGITPYRYLAEQRLELARQFLCEGRMNVTEVACAVGYSSLSHFAKIFRTKFGVNPHEYMAQSSCEPVEKVV